VKLNRRDFLKVSLGTAGLLPLNSPGEALADSSTFGLSKNAVLYSKLSLFPPVRQYKGEYSGG
jgi:hypothetical protein